MVSFGKAITLSLLLGILMLIVYNSYSTHKYNPTVITSTSLEKNRVKIDDCVIPDAQHVLTDGDVFITVKTGR